MPYVFEGFRVRAMIINDEPWWVFNDLCEVLGLAQPHTAVKRVDDDCLASAKAIDGLGRDRDTTIINEPGLYQLVFASRKPSAKDFRRWISHEVVPEIRRNGMYLGGLDLPTALERYAASLREKDAASKRAIAAEAKIEELRPAVTEWRAYMDSSGLCSLAALAQALGGGRTRLIDRLRELGILVSKDASQGGTRPMQPYSEGARGWFAVRMEATNVGPVSVTYATPKGVSEVLRQLVKHGVGERTWKALPSEEDLFGKLAFQEDPLAPK